MGQVALRQFLFIDEAKKLVHLLFPQSLLALLSSSTLKILETNAVGPLESHFPLCSKYKLLLSVETLYQ